MARRFFQYLILAITVTAVAGESPKDIVARIYAAYQGEGTGLSSRNPTFYSTRRKAQIARLERSCLPADGICGPDYDLFIAGQDFQLTKLRITVSEGINGRKIVTSQFNSYGHPVKVVFSFIKERENWKIDDMDVTNGQLHTNLDMYFAPQSTWNMSCWQGTDVTLVEPRYEKKQNDLEAEQIKDSDGIVQRASPHELQIKTKAGLKHFTDAAPFVEKILPNGVLSEVGDYYNYCGHFEDYHLIASRSNIFMLDAETAKTLPANAFVLFSPDRRAYLTATGIPGTSSDASLWSIYKTDGKLSYEGSDILPVNDKKNAVLTYPLWTAKGELTADARCPIINSMNPSEWKYAAEVKLIKSTAGIWSWQPMAHCE